MADYSFIAGSPPPPANPLQTLSGWQQYANQVQQNRNMVLENQTGQQALAQKMSQRHAQILFGLSNLSDDQLPGAAQQALDDELQSGQIDQQRYDVMHQQIQSNTGNPGKLRQTITAGLVANLAGPEAIQALTGKQVTVDNGGQFQGGIQAGPLAANAGALQPSGNVFQKLPGPQFVNTGGTTVPTSGGQVIGGGLQNTPSPQFVETGGQAIPTSGGQQMGAGFNRTLTPGEATQPESRLVQDPQSGQWVVKTMPRAQWSAPGLTPPGAKTPLGSGAYPNAGGGGQATAVPANTESQLGADQKAYAAAQERVPALTTGTQSLGKALNALNAVATGAGTEGLAKMRAYAVSLGNVVGIDTQGVNVQDMNRAELEKYLTDYARQSGTAGRSDEALQTAFKSNASGQINNAAAQDVVRTNIGRDRQSIAAAQLAPTQGTQSHLSSYATSTDPRGFAWDSYTPEQRQQIIKETQGKQGDKSPEYRKLAKAVGDASKLKLLNMTAPQPTNVNASPTNNLQNGPGNALGGQ